MEATLFAVIIASAVSGLCLGWVDWRVEVHSPRIPFWRRTTATVGLMIVTMQVLLFLATFTGRHALVLLPDGFFDEFRLASFLLVHFAPRALLLLALVAIPCVFFGKSQSRRLLLASSGLLFVSCLQLMRF